MSKTAFIKGVTVQDGCCLVEFLLAKGYAVHGIKRPAPLCNTNRSDHNNEDPRQTNPLLPLHYRDLAGGSKKCVLTSSTAMRRLPSKWVM